MSAELSGLSLAAAGGTSSWWQDFRGSGDDNATSSRVARSALYVGGAIIVTAALTLAIPPFRRAFFAGIKSLRGLQKSPVDKANTMDELLTALKLDPSQGEAVRLVEALSADRFYNAAPFRHTVSFGPIKRIVARGIQGFERRIYRTSTNVRCWNSGYDFVEYEIRHADGQVSLARAFQYQTGPFQAMGIGSYDLRPLMHEFGISNADGGLTYLRLEAERGVEMAECAYSEGLDKMRAFVDDSVRQRGLVLLERADQYVSL